MNPSKPDLVFLDEPRAANPLTDLAELRAAIERLPREDPLALLQRFAIWLSDIANLQDRSLQHRLDVIDLIDQVAKNHQVRLVPEYLEALRMRKLTESELWLTSFAFLRDLGDAYLSCLTGYQAGTEKGEGIRDKLPMITCRILRTVTLQLKWTYLRYAKPEDRIWRDLGHAYLLAATWGFAARRSPVYPGRHGEASAQEELLKALMLAMSSPDALTPMQQHIAERVVAHFSGRFALHTSPGPGCTFKFDISMHLAPSRGSKNAGPVPMTRFFGQGTAMEGLHQLAAYLRKHRRLPQDTGIPEDFEANEVEAVLRHLERCWSDAPAARRGKRTKSLARLTVAPGLEDSLRWLEHEPSTGGAGQPVALNMESWVALDTSEGGFRAVLPAQPADWLEVGCLIGVQAESDGSMRIGVVRHMATDPDGKHQVGVEYLGQQAVLVSVYPANLRLASAQAHKGSPAILVSRQPDEQGWVELLLRLNGLANQRHLQMNIAGKIYLLDQNALVEQGKDYLRVAYSIPGA